MTDITFSVRELQAHLGDALRAVDRGDHVIVTSRGRPVAEISRPKRVRRASKEDPIDRKLRQMAAQGKLILATKPGPIKVPCLIPGLAEQWRKDRAERDRILGDPAARRRRRR